jgi:DNA-binding NarL/FixJ family response regulator
MKKAIRVLLVDDHAIVRDGLRAVLKLQPDVEVVGEAASAAMRSQWRASSGRTSS